MMVTGTMIAAVMPQISPAPQPPRSRTDQPSDPSRKPGFARQITNPSYQRSFLSRCRSSICATAIARPPRTLGGTPGATYNTVRSTIQWGCRGRNVPEPPLTIEHMASRPPIKIDCECGEGRSVPYGESWTCERCGRRWDTRQIPEAEYFGRLRRMRRFRVEIVGLVGLGLAVFVPLILFVYPALIFLAG